MVSVVNTSGIESKSRYDACMDNDDKMYSIDRKQLAQMVAAHTCGISDTIPEQADFDIADEMIRWLEHKLRRD